MTFRRLAALGALSASLALTLPQAMAQETDPRLVTLVYDAAKVVKIHGRPGVQATIAFAEDEKIENVAVGDSDKWQITPNKRANLLFARPLFERFGTAKLVSVIAGQTGADLRARQGEPVRIMAARDVDLPDGR